MGALHGPANTAFGEGIGGLMIAAFVSGAVFSFDMFAPLFLVGPALLLATARTPPAVAAGAFATCILIASAATLSGSGPIAAAPLGSTGALSLLAGFTASLALLVVIARALGRRAPRGLEDRLARIIEASPLGTIHFDAAARPTFANRRWTELTGLPLQALGERGWLAAIHPLDRGAATALLARASSTPEPCSAELRYVSADGRCGWAEIGVRQDRAAGLRPGLVVQLTDITARRKAQQALQKLEASMALCPSCAATEGIPTSGVGPSEHGSLPTHAREAQSLDDRQEPGQRSVGGSGTGPCPAAEPMSPLLDEARLDELGAALGAKRLGGLLGLLDTECAERPTRFRRHLARGDLAGLRSEAHNLKGAAISVGAVALADAALAIEDATDLAAASSLVDDLAAIAALTRASSHDRAASAAALAIA